LIKDTYWKDLYACYDNYLGLSGFVAWNLTQNELLKTVPNPDDYIIFVCERGNSPIKKECFKENILRKHFGNYFEKKH
jgi:hypothetical protein